MCQHKTLNGFCPIVEHLDAHGMCDQHCPETAAVHEACRQMLGNGLSHSNLIAQYIKTFDKHYNDHLCSYHGYEVRKPTSHEGNGKHIGAWAFTLTKSPSDSLTEEDMIKAVTKVMNQQSIPAKKFAWYLEYGDEEKRTHPHIHGMYETENGGMIETKHWKRAWNIWNPKQKLGQGFRGGYHRPVRTEEGYDDYIQKMNIKGERYNC